MRYKLTLCALDAPTIIPINYNYPVAAALYGILNAASPEYSEWLHTKGYVTPDGKPMKLFTFSRLGNATMKVEGNTLVFKKNERCSFYLSSPMLEDFMKNFVMGLFSVKKIELATAGVRGRFLIEKIERIDLPEITSEIKCIALSPFVASTRKMYNGSLQTYYYRPDDEDLSNALRENALKKFQLIHNTPLTNSSFAVELDTAYIQRRGGMRNITKLISIKEDTNVETRILAINCPVTLRGNSELINTVLQTGIGEKNSLGFGMLAPSKT